MLWLVNPDEEILDWKAVCGKTARTVWREGRLVAFSTPIMHIGAVQTKAEFTRYKPIMLTLSFDTLWVNLRSNRHCFLIITFYFGYRFIEVKPDFRQVFYVPMKLLAVIAGT